MKIASTDASVLVDATDYVPKELIEMAGAFAGSEKGRFNLCRAGSLSTENIVEICILAGGNGYASIHT